MVKIKKTEAGEKRNNLPENVVQSIPLKIVLKDAKKKIESKKEEERGMKNMEFLDGIF